jgi:hypothetical protein
MSSGPRSCGARRRAVVGAGAVILAGLAALGAGCASPAAQPAPAGPAAPSAARGAAVTFEHVHGLGVDPADGVVYVATHDGLFRTGTNGGFEQVGTTGRDLMGFTVSGPGTFLSSGHPGPGEGVANPLGLVRSTDTGATWTTLSLGGEVDFHALEVSSGAVFGLDAGQKVLRVSTDGGASWQERAGLPALDIAVDPANPAALLATVRGGVVASRDGGATFTGPSGPQLAFVSWAPDGAVYGIALDGGLHTSTAAGATWQQVGLVPGGRPQALTGLGGGRVLAATAGGVYDSRDGGRSFVPLG